MFSFNFKSFYLQISILLITRLIEVKQMGRAHEVRAKSMAATAAAKS